LKTAEEGRQLDAMQEPRKPTPHEASKLITCIMPDDGSHSKLLEDLHQERKILKVEVVSSQAMGMHSNANA